MIADAFVAGVLGLLIAAIIGFGPVVFGNWQDKREQDAWERGREEDRRYWDALERERNRRGQS